MEFMQKNKGADPQVWDQIVPVGGTVTVDHSEPAFKNQLEGFACRAPQLLQLLTLPRALSTSKFALFSLNLQVYSYTEESR